MNEQKAYIGKDSLDSLEKELRELKPRRIFFVHGKSSYEKCGAKKAIDKIIGRLSVEEIFEYSDFSVNPEYKDLQNALAACNEFQPDLIMAVGGGSAIDMSKLIRFFHSYQGNIEKGAYNKTTQLVPLISIPTTSGTGAEATHFAVVYKDKVKYSVEHDDVLPDIAVIYPPFTYNNPPYLTACTGFDALAQGIEAYWNINATDESDEYAKKAIELLHPNLPLAVNSPTDEVRDKMAEGSYWAGRAINITKTTAPHAFSYPFTSYYGYPHGHAVALTFSAIAKYNLQAISQKKKEWLDSTLTHSKDISICGNLQKYINAIGLTFVEKKYDLDLLVSNINTHRLSNNPYTISIDDAKEILRNAIESIII